MRVGILAVVGLAAAVAGCSQSEAEQRASLKSQFVEACKKEPIAAPGLDRDKYCECNGLKMSQMFSKDEMQKMQSGAEPAQFKEKVTEGGVQCLKEQGIGPAPTPAAVPEAAEEAVEEVE